MTIDVPTFVEIQIDMLCDGLDVDWIHGFMKERAWTWETAASPDKIPSTREIYKTVAHLAVKAYEEAVQYDDGLSRVGDDGQGRCSTGGITVECTIGSDFHRIPHFTAFFAAVSSHSYG